MKKFIFNIFCFTLLLFLSYAGFAQTSAEKKLINLASVSAIAVDSKTGTVLFAKNSDILMPIASITNVILDSKLSFKEIIRFAKEDKESINNYFSRVRLESELSRGDTLRIALMSLENLAASSGSYLPRRQYSLCNGHEC